MKEKNIQEAGVKEENKVVIFSLFILAMAILGLCTYMVYSKIETNEISIALISIISTIVGCFSAYLTKSTINNNNIKEK